MMNNKEKLVLAIVILFVATITAWAVGWLGNAGEVAQKEYYPDALLKKYEWFKDASAQLDAKGATIEKMRADLKKTEQMHGNKSIDEWSRTSQEAYNQKLSELTGTIASYNLLAAEYNAQMSKANWRFTNVGDLPPGAKEPLPREYREYKEE